MREDTHKGVGSWRIELAENLLVKPMIIKKDTMEAVDELSDEDTKEIQPSKLEATEEDKVFVAEEQKESV